MKLHQKEKSLIRSVEQMRLMGVFSSACLVFVYFQLFAIVVEFSLQLFLHLGVAWVVNEVVMFQWVGLQVVQFIVIDVRVVADISTAQHAHVPVVFACARYALVFVFCHSPLASFSVEVHQFVALGAHTVVLAHHVPCGVVVIMVVQIVAPTGRVGSEERFERASRHFLRFLHASIIEESGCVVNVLHELVRHATGFISLG